MPHVRSPNRLDAGRSTLLVIDFQEKLVPLIPGQDVIERQMLRLIESAKLLAVPLAATVQYPKGLGPLVASLAGEIEAPEEKRDFSSCVCRDALGRWAGAGRDQIIVSGIETHVCVMQTVLDLIAEGLRPFVVADAVGARHEIDHRVAIERMRDSGATITTAESVMFEWLGTSDRAEFKAISKIIKS